MGLLVEVAGDVQAAGIGGLKPAGYVLDSIELGRETRMEQVPRSNRQCPECGVRLTRYEWSKLWWMSSGMSGRLVQPCQECGTKLRLSSMALVSSISSLGLIIIAVTYIFYPSSVLLLIALGLLLVILIAMLATRVESLPKMPATIEEKPPRIGKPPR